MKIRTRLLLLNLLVALGLSGITTVSIMMERRIAELNRLALLGLSLKSEFLNFAGAGKDLLSTSNLADSLAKWNAGYEGFERLYGEFVGSALLGELLERSGSGGELESFDFLWSATRNHLNNLRGSTEALVLRHGASGLNVQGLLFGYERYGDESFVPAISKVGQFSATVEGALIPKLEALLGTATEAVQDAERFMFRITVAVAVLVGALVFALLLLVSGSLHRRIVKIAESMELLKKKDYTIKVDAGGSDELSAMAELLNGFIDDLSSIIRGVKRLSEEASELKNETAGATVESGAAVTEMTANIASISARIRDFVQSLRQSKLAVEAISGGIDSLDARIRDQASFVERSTTSIEQMNASIGNVAGIADKRAAAVGRLVEITKSGGELIDQTNQTVSVIVEDIEEISQIVGIINGIAEQTNILSMNAAIEAAHAGDAGRGFAVVAEEIRKLADSTDSNAKQVKDMIAGITARINEVLSRSGMSKRAFAEVDAEVSSTSTALQEVSLSMRELSHGSREVMNSMQELREIAKAVRADTSLMKDRTAQVSAGMKELEDNSAGVMDGIAEMEGGTREINAAMVHVSELQVRSGESQERLLEKISVFKVGE